jgi:ribosome maturation factor RimP
MQLPDTVRQIIEASVAESQAILVDVVMRGHYRKPVIEVYLDAPGPVTTTICSDVSRRISGELDGRSLIAEDYRLEVSSPGLDRPLRFLWQYKKHIGRPFRITRVGAAETEAVTGTLASVEDDAVVLKDKAAHEIRLPFSDIGEARIVLPW